VKQKQVRLLHNNVPCDLYRLLSTLRTSKSRNLQQAGHVARIEKTKAYVHNLKGKHRGK
jgi:hypothetical protein